MSVPLISSRFFLRNGLSLNMILTGYIIILTPVISILIALFTKIKKDPIKLASFFFAIEMPVIFWGFIRLIFIRQMTPVYWLLFLSALFSVIGFAILLFKQKFLSKTKTIISFLSQETAFIIITYISILILFFLPIILVGFLKLIYIIGFKEIDEVIKLIIETGGLIFSQLLLGALLFIPTFGLLFITPIIVIILYYKSFKLALQNLKTFLNKKTTNILCCGFAGLFIIFAIFLSYQHNNNSYISKFEAAQDAKTFDE